MKTIQVKSLRGNYAIVTGSGILEKTGALMLAAGLTGKVLIVTQRRIPVVHLTKVKNSLLKSGFDARIFFLPDGETAKSQENLFKVYGALLKNGFERRDTLLALGGGVTGDLAGFAAATYLRGILFVNVPTTLLAQVDSAIGGKTGINLKEGKNLAGSFYPPKLVISDAKTLITLPERELKAALGEVVKYGVISDAKLFRRLEGLTLKSLKKNNGLLAEIVNACSAIKAGVVSRDEFETLGERMVLNFGHTFGHGFEKALNYKKILHGEAVAVGMICAGRLAVDLKMFSQRDFIRMENLMRRLELPVSVEWMGVKLRDVLSAMAHDKKKKGGRLRFVLPVRIGKVVVRDGVSEASIQNIIIKAGARS